MPADRLKALILAASEQDILCIGDVMLDDYIYGSVRRISPEAPVPVLAEERREKMPGGAANTARNLASMGARTRLFGQIGSDAAGQELLQLFEGIERVDAQLFVSPTGTTTSKTRLISAGQQMLRLDRDASAGNSVEAQAKLLTALAVATSGATAILLSDYGKGVVSDEVIEAVLSIAGENSIPVIVDPKGRDIARYGSADLIKPNAAELSDIVNLPTRTDSEVEAALNEALNISPAKAILVTRAADGLSYLQRGGSVVHIRAVPQAVFDVSGAGDTSLAALGIAVSAGADLQDAAELALLASGLAVGQVGTAAVSQFAMLAAVPDKLMTQADAKLHRVAWREAGARVGFTNGCFDLLHPGHLKLLEAARAKCDRLLVGLNSDASVTRLKGQGRPVNNQAARAEVLAGLSVVDGVVVFEEDTPLELIQALEPDLLVKGGDYTLKTIVGADEVIAAGGDVHIVPLVEGYSTTQMIARTVKNPVGDP